MSDKPAHGYGTRFRLRLGERILSDFLEADGEFSITSVPTSPTNPPNSPVGSPISPRSLEALVDCSLSCLNLSYSSLNTAPMISLIDS